MIMQKKKVFFIVTAVALALGSCSNDEDLGTPSGTTDKPIEFRTVSDEKTTLRAAVTDTDNILSFTVTGWWTAPVGATESSAYLFNAEGITRGEDDNWAYLPVRYWPTAGDVDFYAYSPSSSRNVTTGIKDYAAGGTIAYEVPPVSKNNAQEDFLVAKAMGKTSGTVTLNFHHALSRIKFNGKTTRTDITYVVKEIELVNLYESAELDFVKITEAGSITYTPGTPVQPWTDHAGITNYAVDMGDSPIYLLSNDYSSLLGETNAILVMPQETGYYYDTDPAVENKFAIKVSYQAFADGIYYAGDEGVYEDRYYPVLLADGSPITFEMGRQYTFNLIFGDEAGDDISFTVAVGSWDVVNNVTPE